MPLSCQANCTIWFSTAHIPNARSSHAVPTLRGGGLAIVVTFLFGLAVLRYSVAYLPLVVFAVAVGRGNDKQLTMLTR